MSDTERPDDGPARPDRIAGTPDFHGQAAILLVESLVHGLVARSLITVADAIEIVDNAADAQEEISFDAGDTPIQTASLSAILRSISATFATDLDGRQENQQPD